VNKFYFNLDI